MLDALRHRLGIALARYLSQRTGRGHSIATCPPERLAATIRKGDVLLVDGDSRFSVAIRYLTQSTWSHAALCIGNALPDQDTELLLEADVVEGVRVVPLQKYDGYHTRICRPVGLETDEIDRVVDFAVARLGDQYDIKNIVDLVRYLIRTPPVPTRYRRRMLALGSGDPTRAICSSLIAQAFQSVRYPILPEVLWLEDDPDCVDCRQELLHIRHHSLFAPRDFDVSPYFGIVKPTLEGDFDPHRLRWADDLTTAPP